MDLRRFVCAQGQTEWEIATVSWDDVGRRGHRRLCTIAVLAIVMEVDRKRPGDAWSIWLAHWRAALAQ